MTCDEIRPAIDALVDGELAREEERVLRGHLAGCPACARELEERRDFSESVRGAFDRALEAAEPPPGTRERLAERLHGSSRRRLAVPARLAAALVFGIAIGLGAWAVGMSRPTKLQLEVAEGIRGTQAKREEILRNRRDTVRDLEQARKTVRVTDPQDSRALVVQEGAAVIETRAAEPAAKALAQLIADTASPDPAASAAARSALKRLEPGKLEELRKAVKEAPRHDVGFVGRIVSALEDRAQPVERGKVVINRNVNGISLSFIQRDDGRVKLVVPGQLIEAPSVAELLRRNVDVCRKYGISGREGSVAIGDSTAAVDLRGQLELLFRTSNWNEDILWDAYRVELSKRTPDVKQIEARVKEVQERCRRAVQEAPVPDVRVDLEQILKDVKAMSRQQAEETRVRLEKERQELDARLLETRELRAGARIFRVVAEEVRKEK